MGSRIILITGANGGLGQAIARTFLAESKDNFVWLGLRRGREKADALATEFPEQSNCLNLDVTQPAAWQQGVAKILSQHKRLDVLVNNAGHHQDGLLANLPPSAWQQVIASNLDSVFHGCQAVMPAMIS